MSCLIDYVTDMRMAFECILNAWIVQSSALRAHIYSKKRPLMGAPLRIRNENSITYQPTTDATL
ncbi:unnamed protein product [Ceratitis capitata]|uniref:(Mediterranean fruit fly) hypothetical protein n=1 Tax=Ceratitis capitata TaxID=7213 RepID=A0A811V0K3_CERCA|nr:unnamed protein product [Ceratitis capitata]